MSDRTARLRSPGADARTAPRTEPSTSASDRLGSFFVGSGLVAFACLGGVVLDSSLGATGRVVGLAVALIGVVAVTAITRLGGMWRGLAGAIAGSAGTVVGLGYGSQRLAEGTWVLAVPAIAAGAVSFVALILGGVLAIRAVPGWWRLLAVPIAAVSLQFILLPALYGTIGTHGRRAAVTDVAPPGAVVVSLRAPDGVELGAWYTPGDNGAAVVLLPGAGGTRSGTAAHARALHELGYGVLALDHRGTGASGGQNNLWGWDGTPDVAAAVAWLSARPEVEAGIGLVGLSMGGEQAITAAPLLPDVGAVVSEGVQARTPADTWYVRDGVRGWVERTVSTVMWTVADLWTDAAPPESLRASVGRLGGRALLVIAADAADERAVAADLERRSSTVSVWQTVGIGHTQSLDADPSGWRQRVGTFLDAALLGR